MKTIAQVRADMPALEGRVFLNAGSLCPTPTPVMEAYFSSYRDWHARGAGHPAHYEAMRDDVTRIAKVKLASLLNCLPDEVTLTSNATEGVNIVAFGLDWRPGDEVIITDAEHPANS
ncbi:MAG TPA: aminotransferase class V-fold PLP-dependent enzyme, partial [Bacillota bacterium]|nr:aminotransferase class V-fold PLP-dependent enzyme [Bacillota bacterium]